jgi:hypothetical protein
MQPSCNRGAYRLARSGAFGTVTEIEKRLKREEYSAASINVQLADGANPGGSAQAVRGSASSGPSFFTLPTRLSTGHIDRRSEG